MELIELFTRILLLTSFALVLQNGWMEVKWCSIDSGSRDQEGEAQGDISLGASLGTCKVWGSGMS